MTNSVLLETSRPRCRRLVVMVVTVVSKVEIVECLNELLAA